MVRGFDGGGPVIDGAVRLAVVDDSFLVREAVTGLLDADDRVRVVGAASDFDSAIRLVDEQCPQVVVTDVRMPPSGTDEGIQLACRLQRTHPPIGVVVLSQYVNPEYAMRLLEGGAGGRAYLLKDRITEADQLMDAVLAVAVGGSRVDPTVVDALVAARGADRNVLSGLTSREREVLAQIATGRNNRAVADRLVLTPRAVEKHINAIFAKLDLAGESSIDRRVSAVLMFLSDS
jgi:DNA-binding NarL/FixJ family response regulator